MHILTGTAYPHGYCIKSIQGEISYKSCTWYSQKGSNLSPPYVQTFMTWPSLNSTAPMIPLLWFYTTVVLYTSCMMLGSVVHHLSFLPFLLTTGLNLLKLQTKNSCVFPQVRRIFSKKQYTVMWQVLWLSPSPEQARPYVEASKQKLRDVSILGLVSAQGRKSKNSNVNNFLSSCFTFQSELFPKFVF